MITAPDFQKKQIVFVMFNAGEKLAFSNDNMVVKNADGSVKLQITCYRLFIVFAVGNCSVTSVLLQNARRFGFFIAMMTPGFRLYALIGAEKDGNTMLKRIQYEYGGLDIAKHITKNKIDNQQQVLKNVRNKNEFTTQAIDLLNNYSKNVAGVDSLEAIMAYEGLASKVYFKAHFNNVSWAGRQPRIKRDYVNSTLDLGYTLLFTFVDALLSSYGFDTYCGVLHRQFYLRKSLVCDIVEPFRTLIDMQIKKSINLKQIKEDDFVDINHRMCLRWEKSSDYVRILMAPIIENKDSIFLYIQHYYRAFMKQIPFDEYPVYKMEG